MGYFGLTGTLAMAIAPALGLSIMNSLGFSWVYNISALSILLCILLSLPIHFHRPEGNAQIPRGPIFEKAAIFPGITVFFVTMTYGAVVSFIALYAEQQGVPNIGPFFTVL